MCDDLPMGRLARVIAALVFVIVAASTPVMGYAAAEEYQGRRFYTVFEGDWLFVFALLAGGASVWAAIRLASGALRRS